MDLNRDRPAHGGRFYEERLSTGHLSRAVDIAGIATVAIIVTSIC